MLLSHSSATLRVYVCLRNRLLQSSLRDAVQGLAEGQCRPAEAHPRARLLHDQLEDSRGLEPSMPFSPCRHSDGHRSSYLLRAVAQLRSQLRARLPQVPLGPGRCPASWCWVGGALLGPAVLSKCPRLCLVALCEAEAAPPAFRPYDVETRFNWKLFWQFLRPYLLVLGAAIVVRYSPAPLKPGLGNNSVKGLQKPRPELRGDSLPASWIIRRPWEAAWAGLRREARDTRRIWAGELRVQVQGPPEPGILSLDSQRGTGAAKVWTAAGEEGLRSELGVTSLAPSQCLCSPSWHWVRPW